MISFFKIRQYAEKIAYRAVRLGGVEVRQPVLGEPDPDFSGTDGSTLGHH
jgi:hypothetical protein